jgi:hypothetical protein
MSSNQQPETPREILLLLNDLPFLLSLFDSSFQWNYTPLSLKVMENALDELYPEGHDPMPTTYIPFGIYLGETIVKNIPGAHWAPVPESRNLAEIAVTIPVPKHIDALWTAYPIIRVQEFWHDRTDTIFGYFHMIKDMAKGKFDPSDESKMGQWQNTMGAQYRVLRAKPEQEEEFRERMDQQKKH